MRKPIMDFTNHEPLHNRWSQRDFIAAFALFLASAAVVLWQNAHLCVLWDASYTLDTSLRIALGQMPYRDFPLVHSPLTFLLQAAIMHLAGRVFLYHVLYAALVNGLSTLLAWRIALRTLRDSLRAAWSVSLLLAAPLIPLGVYSILPFPSYDCDTAFSILLVLFLLQRLPEDSESAAHFRVRFFCAGAVLPLPLFFKQNIGLPFLAAAFALIFMLLIVRQKKSSGAKAQHLFCDSCGTTEKAAEKGLNLSETLEKHPAGAEAHPLLSAPCGPTKVVPLLQNIPKSSFSAACEVVPLLQNLPELSFSATCEVAPWLQNIPRSSFSAASEVVPLLQNLPELSFSAASEVVPCYKTSPFSNHSATALVALLTGACATLFTAILLLHFTAGVRNYLHWTIQFASERRLPGLQPMLAIYAEPSLLWWLPCIGAALALLHTRFSKALWVRLLALLLLSAPFLWTLISLALSSDSEDRADSLLALWPLLLILSAALSLWNFWRRPRLHACIPILILAAMQGTFLSQQLWGSTYAIWPLLVLLIAEMIAFLASLEQPATAAPVQPCRFFLAPHRCSRPAGAHTGVGEDAHTTAGLESGATVCFFLAPSLAAIITVTLLLCGGLYTLSEERLSYVQLPDGPALHSSFPALKGMAVAGSYLPEFEELLRFSAKEIPLSDGLILIPGEDPFYFATGRTPQFPVLLFDNATDPLSSPALLVAETERRRIRWLIVKRNLQIKEDVTPRREATLQALQQVFQPYCKLAAYDVYRRP